MKKVLTAILIIFFAFIFIFPVLATITNSFMTATEVGMRYGQTARGSLNFITLIPGRIALDQYYEILVERYMYLNMFWNSVKLSVSITVLHVIIAILTAFVFAKIEFKGRDLLFFIFIVVMMMPFQVTLLPNYIQARNLKIIDTYYAIILPGIFTPFGVFLLRQAMRYIPDEFLEAVSLESNSVFDILRVAVIPAVKPGIIALIVLVFAENWNMVEQPLVLLKDPLKYPLSIQLNSIIKGASNVAFAGSMMYMVPIIILYFYCEEHLLKGMEAAKL